MLEMEFKVLPNGSKMPMVGLGTWLATAKDDEDLTKAMEAALEIGYRHFDTAYVYLNEGVIGNVLKKWLTSGRVKREDLFITTKLPLCAMDDEKVERFLNRSLASLRLDYVDLYLIHIPTGLDSENDDDMIPISIDDGKVAIDHEVNLEEVWKAMEEQVTNGKAKSIGLSNFDSSQVERIVKVANIKPANLQIEVHVYSQQKSLREVCDKHGIPVCAYSPLRAPGLKYVWTHLGKNPDSKLDLLDDPEVARIAASIGKTPAQILLRFLLQQGLIVIPKTISVARLKENIQLFDFTLSPEDMKSLEALNKGPEGLIIPFETLLPGIGKSPEYPKFEW